MTKVMCKCIQCEHNASNIAGTAGECVLPEIMIEDFEFVNEEGGYGEVANCSNFVWAYKTIIYKDLEVKKDAND